MAEGERSILVAEDNAEILAVWAKELRRPGWRVTAVRDGRRALERLARDTFSMVVCDLHLGPGPTALDILRAYPDRWAETPFIVVTGLGTISACRDALKLGAEDFIEKPVSTGMFLFIVESAMHRAAGGVPKARTSAENVDEADTGAYRVREALRCLDRVAFNHDTSVKTIADAAGVSPDHLTRLFQRHTGRSPIDVLHTLRISQAVKMLPNPHLSVFQVAYECGYKSYQQFAKWFRRKHGIGPAEWRTSQAVATRRRSAGGGG